MHISSSASIKLSQLLIVTVFSPILQGLSSPRWQQLASRPLSLSAGLCGSEAPPARADATFKVTMVPGDGVGPELMTAVKEVFKVNLDGAGVITVFCAFINHVVHCIQGSEMQKSRGKVFIKHSYRRIFFPLEIKYHKMQKCQLVI